MLIKHTRAANLTETALGLLGANGVVGFQRFQRINGAVVRCVGEGDYRTGWGAYAVGEDVAPCRERSTLGDAAGAADAELGEPFAGAGGRNAGPA